MAIAHPLFGHILGTRRALVACDNNDMGCLLALGCPVFGGMGIDKNQDI